MLPEGQKDTAKNQLHKDHAGVQDHDPYLVSLVTQTKDAEQAQSENIMTVLDEMQGTASRRRTQLIKPDS